MLKDSSASDSGQLPADLVQILVELSNALSKHGMYPSDHPMLIAAAESLLVGLTRTLDQRTALAFGITPTQIIAAGIASDPGHPILRELAARLHRRDLGALKIYRGVERRELVEALRFLSSEERIRDDAPTSRWPHIRVQPLSYSQLELIGDADLPAGARSWATRLWLDLSRAALETEELPETADPTQVARAMDARQWDESYGRKIGESLDELLEACRARGGTDALVLQSHISRLLTTMAPETLEQLVRLERSEADRQRFLLEIANSMAVDAVLDLLQAAAAATSRTISPALIQLLGKLAEHSETGRQETRGRAEFAFRNQVRELIEGWETWETREPAPPDHRRTLDQLSLAGKSPLRGHSSTYECEPERSVMLSLEVGVAGAATRDAAAFLIHQGQAVLLRELFARAPSPGMPREILEGVVSEDTLRSLLARDPLDLTGLDMLVPLLEERALLPLLDALGVAESVERRDQLLGLLEPYGDAAGSEVVERLVGAPWPAQRNLLFLLARLSAIPRGFSPAPYIDHADPRVRTEALRILLRGSATRTRTICEALTAPEPATVRMAVFAAADECPPAAVPLLIPLVERGDMEAGVGAAAIMAIAPVAQPLVVECLAGLCLLKGRWFRRSRIAGKSPIVLAALTGLARNWADHHRAREVLALATSHPDPEIRLAVERRSR